MDQFRVLVSLTTKDNDFQREQAAAAERAAAKLGMKIDVIFADNDAITQSQQLLEVIQSRSASRPDAIVLEPVGTGFPQVAMEAAKASIGWAILNRKPDYLAEVRRIAGAPVFAVSSDHLEIGRLQGRQFAKLLPEGGQMIYIQGPASSSPALQRAQGMAQTKPANIQVKTLSAQWTEISAHTAGVSFLRLRTSRDSRIDLVGGQNDLMALGMRKALKETVADWSWIPFTGVDGMAETGQRWVREGQLAATIVVPTNADTALEMLHQALMSKTQPPDITFTKPKSLPELDRLVPKNKQTASNHA
jgi:ABC-type sugar transport system substrate-binding protein